MNTDFFQTHFSPKCNKIAVVILLFLSSIGSTAPMLQDDIHTWAITSIDYVYKENFKEAEETARKIIKKYPDHPAGYFFMAVVLDAWMFYYQSDKKENEFYQYCDLAIEKGEKTLDKNPKDAWAKFFIGGADGYKGTYESRYERWITAFRFGWKGVSVLLELESSGANISDINYGIGSYNYWRSALMKDLWWMPGVDDKREIGIKKLQEALIKGVYTKTAASVALIDIMINEKRFNEALEIANEMLAVYPNTLAFHWGKARSLFGLKQYAESEIEYKLILKHIEIESSTNHYNSTLCHYWLAKNYYNLKRYTLCIEESNRMNLYSLPSDMRKRLDPYFNDMQSFKRLAMSSH